MIKKITVVLLTVIIFTLLMPLSYGYYRLDRAESGIKERSLRTSQSAIPDDAQIAGSDPATEIVSEKENQDAEDKSADKEQTEEEKSAGNKEPAEEEKSSEKEEPAEKEKQTEEEKPTDKEESAEEEKPAEKEEPAEEAQAEDKNSAETGTTAEEKSKEEEEQNLFDRFGLSGEQIYIAGSVLIIAASGIISGAIAAKKNREKKEELFRTYQPDISIGADFLEISFLSGVKKGYSEVVSFKDNLVIGSSPKCGIFLEGINIEDTHARIYANRGMLFIEDLDSDDGTYLNGTRLYSANRLRTGSLITVGSVTFSVSY